LLLISVAEVVLLVGSRPGIGPRFWGAAIPFCQRKARLVFCPDAAVGATPTICGELASFRASELAHPPSYSGGIGMGAE
jgi:hypothetical protein